MDITPDFRATACFGSYDPVECSQFEDLIQLERYLLLKKSYPRAQHNCSGKCANCPDHELLICQGGCLGFANVPKSEALVHHETKPAAPELDVYGHPVPDTQKLDTYGNPLSENSESASDCQHDCGTCGKCFGQVTGVNVPAGNLNDPPASLNQGADAVAATTPTMVGETKAEPAVGIPVEAVTPDVTVGGEEKPREHVCEGGVCRFIN